MKDLPKLILIALISSFITVLLVSKSPTIQTIENPVKVIENEKITKEEKIIRDESAIIQVVKQTSDSVVSITATNHTWPFISSSGGTGFIVGENLILTNKHVVSDSQAEYVVVTNDEQKYKAKILALDPIFDIAILKTETGLKALELGDSSQIQVGQTVIAIGNALGEFSNTVSVGVVSGLKRSIGADLRSLVQTDAAINRGNSGGPLLNLAGQVIGINVAMATGAENIGFAIPINAAKKAINDVKTKGKIEYPFLGIKYNINNHLILEVVPESPADKAGLLANDILLEFDNQKLHKNNLLSDIILKYKAGDKIKLKILRDGQEKFLHAVLGGR